jgi:putative transposase
MGRLSRHGFSSFWHIQPHIGRRGVPAKALQPASVREIVRGKEIEKMEVRYGYRRSHVLLRREVNENRVSRHYREMGLQLRNKTPKQGVKVKLRSDYTTALEANDVWAMDFVHDQLFDGTKIRMLTIIDTLTRLSPAADVRQSYRVVETLERGAAEFGYPIRLPKS